MSTWVIPYVDQPLDFWHQIAAQFSPHIREVYLPMPGGVIASGRPPQPEKYMESFLRAAPLAQAVLINAIVLPQPIEQIGPRLLVELQALYDRYGISRVTVANLALARLIKERLPQFWVTASTLMGLSTPAQIVMAQDYLDAVVPEGHLLRDLHSLRRLRQAFHGELRLIVNEACLPGCPFRIQHFYEMAYSQDFPQSLCGSTLNAHPWLRLTGAWVLPRHLHYYAGLFDSLKLAGRVALRDPAVYFRVLGAYIHRTDLLPCDIGGGPASVLAPIDLPDKLFETLLNCDKNCGACRLCQDYYAHAISGLSPAAKASQPPFAGTQC